MRATPPAPTPAVSANPRCFPPLEFLVQFNAIFYQRCFLFFKKQRFDFFVFPPDRNRGKRKKSAARFHREKSAARFHKRHPASGSRKGALFPQK
jgi:hypothetical protein